MENSAIHLFWYTYSLLHDFLCFPEEEVTYSVGIIKPDDVSEGRVEEIKQKVDRTWKDSFTLSVRWHSRTEDQIDLDLFPGFVAVLINASLIRIVKAS